MFAEPSFDEVIPDGVDGISYRFPSGQDSPHTSNESAAF